MRNLMLMLATVCCVITGCAQPAVRTVERGVPITDEFVATIQEGVTTKEDITAKLGQPFSSSKIQDGAETAIWSYTETQQRGRTENNRFFGSRYDITSNATMLSVTFTKAGVVKTYIKSSGTHGNQPVNIKTEPVNKPSQ